MTFYYILYNIVAIIESTNSGCSYSFLPSPGGKRSKELSYILSSVQMAQTHGTVIHNNHDWKECYHQFLNLWIKQMCMCQI